jgi:CheY-like chemotaxis protein
MQPQKRELTQDDADTVRRSIHDVAAAIISVRALAETLADHVPTLVAMSRSRYSPEKTPVLPETLDALPAIPAEIIGLCEIARGALQALGKEAGATGTDGVASGSRIPHTNETYPGSSPNQGGEKGPTVLLVEDEETVRYVLSQALQAQGCLVTSAADGEEALGLLAQRVFDLVLMDLRIPGMTGWETAKIIRQRESTDGRHTRIVGLTASPLLEDQQRAKAAGMDEVLVKPIGETALQSILNRFT